MCYALCAIAIASWFFVGACCCMLGVWCIGAALRSARIMLGGDVFLGLLSCVCVAAVPFGNVPPACCPYRRRAPSARTATLLLPPPPLPPPPPPLPLLLLLLPLDGSHPLCEDECERARKVASEGAGMGEGLEIRDGKAAGCAFPCASSTERDFNSSPLLNSMLPSLEQEFSIKTTARCSNVVSISVSRQNHRCSAVCACSISIHNTHIPHLILKGCARAFI